MYKMEAETNNRQEDESVPETPMGRVWSIVLGTMFIVSLVSFIWHYLGMLELRKEQTASENEVSRDIERLVAFRADVAARSTTTPGSNTK